MENDYGFNQIFSQHIDALGNEMVNGYRNFSFGDKVIITNNGLPDKYHDKEFIFIEVHGEDYIFYNNDEKCFESIRAYYFNKFTKIKEENIKVTTWEFTYEK